MLMKLPAVIGETALSRSSIYAMINEGRFPLPVRIGISSVAWRDEDVEAWKQTLPPAAPAISGSTRRVVRAATGWSCG